jgi:hypothetical protein
LKHVTVAISDLRVRVTSQVKLAIMTIRVTDDNHVTQVIITTQRINGITMITVTARLGPSESSKSPTVTASGFFRGPSSDSDGLSHDAASRAQGPGPAG